MSGGIVVDIRVEMAKRGKFDRERLEHEDPLVKATGTRVLAIESVIGLIRLEPKRDPEAIIAACRAVVEADDILRGLQDQGDAG